MSNPPVYEMVRKEPENILKSIKKAKADVERIVTFERPFLDGQGFYGLVSNCALPVRRYHELLLQNKFPDSDYHVVCDGVSFMKPFADDRLPDYIALRKEHEGYVVVLISCDPFNPTFFGESGFKYDDIGIYFSAYPYEIAQIISDIVESEFKLGLSDFTVLPEQIVGMEELYVFRHMPIEPAELEIAYRKKRESGQFEESIPKTYTYLEKNVGWKIIRKSVRML